MFDSDRLERLDSEQRNIIKTQGKVKFEKGRDVLNPEAESLEEARQAHFMRVQCAPPPPSTPNASADQRMVLAMVWCRQDA